MARTLVVGVVAALLVVAAGSARVRGPSIRPVSVPRAAVVGVPWRATVRVKGAGRRPAMSVSARGLGTVRGRVTTTRRRGVHRLSLTFPRAGAWVVSVRVRGRSTRLGAVAADVARDPLLANPFALAVEPSGSLLVGQLPEGGLVRLAPGSRAATVVPQVGSAHVEVAPSGVTYAVSTATNRVLRLEGSALVPSRAAGLPATPATAGRRSRLRLPAPPASRQTLRGMSTSPSTTAGSGVSPPTARSRSTPGSAEKGSPGTAAPPRRRGSSTHTTSRSGRTEPSTSPIRRTGGSGESTRSRERSRPLPPMSESSSRWLSRRTEPSTAPTSFATGSAAGSR